MKAKGLYFYGYAEACMPLRNTGVEQKVAGQIKALCQGGLSCRQIKYEGRVKPSVIRKVAMRLPFRGPMCDWLSDYRPEFDGYDFYYIRRPNFLSLRHLLAIRRMRRRNPDAVVLYELWTYPIKKELTRRWQDYPLWWKEAFYMPLMKRYIDRFVVVGDFTKISGVPAIPMRNGIDMSLIAPCEGRIPDDGTIHIAAVAKLSVWHGYDRFIRGLHEYYRTGGKRKIVVHIVGDGYCRQALEEMRLRLGLEENVVMHGYETGSELDAVYERCRLGLISLATQDKDIYVHSTLKSREYLAKGLPTIATGITDVFVGTAYKYNLELPMDEEITDIRRVVDFHNEIYGSRPRTQVIAEIRAFAERNIAVEITMEPIISYITETIRSRRKADTGNKENVWRQEE